LLHRAAWAGYVGEPVLHHGSTEEFLMHKLPFLLLLGTLLASSLHAATPVIFECDGSDLSAQKQKYQAGDKQILRIVNDLCKEADKALGMSPPSVMQKEPMPPSGDKHDYMSLSPYWWPDPSKPDGRPYIRRDGQFNPERSKYDLDKMESMSDAAGRLALVYYFTGEEKYAAKASQLIKVWFLDPATKMNPNIKYGQFVPGIPTEDRSSGVIESNRLRRVVDADGLMHGSKSWSDDDSRALKAWFREYLDYLLKSPQGQMESKQPNNHGTWYGVQTMTYALYLGDEELAKKLAITHGEKRIASQIQPDGSQPYELERTRGFDYTRFNVLAHIELASLAQRIGVDLWNYQTDDGRSLRRALDWLVPYAIGEKEWNYKQISPPKMKEMAVVLRRAANAYHDRKYEQLISKLKNGEGLADLDELMFPAKTE
jgi:hypothetical protein